MAIDDTPYDELTTTRPDVHDARRLTLHAERLVASVVPVRDRVARIGRRVVTERTTIEVDLRREELVIEYLDGDGTELRPSDREPVVVVLRAEEAEVRTVVRAIEEVRISTRPVREIRTVGGDVAHEELDVQRQA